MSKGSPKRKVVIVDGGMETFQFLTDNYIDEWDTQEPIGSLDEFWDALNSGRVSQTSRILLFSDEFFTAADLANPASAEEDLSLFEQTIATLAPHGCVMIINYNETSRLIIEERISNALLRLNGELSPFFFVSVADPIGDINDAVDSYIDRMEKQAEVRKEEEKKSAPNNVAEVPTTGRRGMVISSTSSKGGSGKSTTAILLASQLARSSQKAFEEGLVKRPLEVCLVDMDIRDGQIGFLVGKLSPTALNIRMSPRWDADVIRKNLIYDKELGVNVLLAPKRPRTHEDTPPEFYEAVILQLRSMFDIVILDTSVNYLDALLEKVCYPLSDHILLVTEMGSGSVFGMARWFQEALAPVEEQGMGLDPDSISIVINKAMDGINMTQEMVQTAAENAEIFAAVPSQPRKFFSAANLARLGTLLEDPEIGTIFFNLANKVLRGGYRLSPLVDPPGADSQQSKPKANLVPIGGNASKSRIKTEPVAKKETQRRGFFRRD